MTGEASDAIWVVRSANALWRLQLTPSDGVFYTSVSRDDVIRRGRCLAEDVCGVLLILDAEGRLERAESPQKRHTMVQ